MSGRAMMHARLAGALGLALCAIGTARADDSRTGVEIYERFRSGLAEPACPAGDDRWKRHYIHAPRQLAQDARTLQIFGHVVDSVRAADLPTEYALIPFVESGYRPSARSSSGPAGLWQMIASTARNHKVPMRAGYDGRMSPVDSTKAAVRYLKTLHGMFGGNWRLAVMAYNVGEYRVLGALRQSGQAARTAKGESLAGLPSITRSYDDKLHAISCVLAEAGGKPSWVASLDHPVKPLAPVHDSASMIAAATPDAPEPAATSAAVAAADVPAAPAHAAAPATATATARVEAATAPIAVAASTAATATVRRHTVAAGESLWRIARRYDVSVGDLLDLNGLQPGRLLAPGMVLAIDSLPGVRK